MLASGELVLASSKLVLSSAKLVLPKNVQFFFKGRKSDRNFAAVRFLDALSHVLRLRFDTFDTFDA